METNESHFHADIVLAGGGLAGLTLAVELAKRPFFQEKSMILLDRDAKQNNDRTWCFWAEPQEILPPIVFKTWDKCLFYGENGEKSLQMNGYRYYMVRGVDFYRWAGEQLARRPNLRRVQTNIRRLDTRAGEAHTDAGVFSADFLFNSAFTPAPLLPSADALYPAPPLSTAPGAVGQSPVFSWLLQHFCGWIIRTTEAVFDPQTATLMDFRIEQKGETRFVYVLPFSETEALVEFTVFSPALCTKEEYDEEIKKYIHIFLKINTFEIVEREFGVIPMTDYGFRPNHEGRTTHIGSAGGFVKGSSGYAFKRTQRRLRQFAADWEKNGKPAPEMLRSAYRFRLYDSILLRVLNAGIMPGKAVFSHLFGKLPAHEVFRFLDEDSTFAQDWRVLNAPPSLPFMKAVFMQFPALAHL